MSDRHDYCRTMTEALADLYDKRDRASQISVFTRLDLERMIEGLEAEIHDRAERVLQLYS
jgi:hypothetical protein